jgi:hypothetical protein
MAKPRADKKRQKAKPTQPPLPGMPPPEPPGTARVLPMQQAPPRNSRVGYLSIGSASDPRRMAIEDAFRQGLHDLGYSENGNVSLETRFAEGAPLAGPAQRVPHLVVWT